MTGMTKKVNVRSNVPVTDMSVAVVERVAVAVSESRAPMGTEHFLGFSLRSFTSLSVMKFVLEPVSSRTLQRIGSRLSFSRLSWAVITGSLLTELDASERVGSGVIVSPVVADWTLDWIR
jgi:hypothetical protein